MLLVRVIKSRRTIWVEHVARKEDMRNAQRIMAKELERMRPLGIPGSRWDDI
jgi:hypothetical protein